ncbi:MAG: hypothetical protein J6Q13_02985 [Clostridia bacterium]|nr:hypothetical protein [Clostridia bacterium]
MGVLDGFKDLINASFSEWVRVEDNLSPYTIDMFPYDVGVDEDETENHCWKCVTVNKCWFKNEKNKKPEKYDYSLLPNNKLLNIIRGLYHPKCHCKEFAIDKPKVEDIELVIPDKKKLYTIEMKYKWINGMGYYNYDEFFKVFYNKCKEAFVNGDYYHIDHNNYGFKINLIINMPGYGDKKGNVYKLKSGYSIFPNGKLKLNTHLGGWQNEDI